MFLIEILCYFLKFMSNFIKLIAVFIIVFQHFLKLEFMKPNIFNFTSKYFVNVFGSFFKLLLSKKNTSFFIRLRLGTIGGLIDFVFNLSYHKLIKIII